MVTIYIIITFILALWLGLVICSRYCNDIIEDQQSQIDALKQLLANSEAELESECDKEEWWQKGEAPPWEKV